MRKHLLYRLAKHKALTGGCAALHNIPCGMRSVKSMRSIAHTKLYPNLPLLSRKIPMFFRTNWVTQDVVLVFFPFNNTIRFPQFVEKVWKFFCYNINIELPFGVFFDIMLVTNPQCSCSPASPVMPTGALALASKVPAHDQGNGFLRLWGNLCMRCVPLHPPEALVSHLAACFSAP